MAAADHVREICRELSMTGTTVPEARAVRMRWSVLLRAAPPDEIVAVGTALIAAAREVGTPEDSSPGFGLRLIGGELISTRGDASALVDAAAIERCAEGLADWASVDLVGCELVGVAWRDGRIGDAAVKAWTKSPDRWRRRLALVATIPLNMKSRGGTGDAARTLMIARMLMADRDDMVVKALSWALRELAKADAPSVRAFLAEPGVRVAARVTREVENLLRTGLKNPRPAKRAKSPKRRR